MADKKLNMGGFEQIYSYLQNAMPQTPYPESMTQDEFMSLYNNFRNGIGMDDATLKANLEAAMRPGYDRSIAEMDQRRRMSNAEIDVDAASRGMGNSTWVTDAKLQNLKSMEHNIADLDANYNATLYNNLLSAMQNRDANALNNAWNFAQMQNNDRLNAWNAQNAAQQNAFSNAWSWWNSNKGGGSGSPTPNPNRFFDGQRWWDSPEAYAKAIKDAYDLKHKVIPGSGTTKQSGNKNQQGIPERGLVGSPYNYQKD